jgi:hypothetical protein
MAIKGILNKLKLQFSSTLAFLVGDLGAFSFFSCLALQWRAGACDNLPDAQFPTQVLKHGSRPQVRIGGSGFLVAETSCCRVTPSTAKKTSTSIRLFV